MSDTTLSFNILARDNATSTITGISKRFGNLRVGFAAVSKGIVGAAAGAGVALVGLATAGATMGVKTAASLEQAQIGFETLLGSGQKAEAFLKDLQGFAAKTPFELPGLISASRQLIGVGASADSVIPTLQAWGDASGALGLSQEQFERAMLATTQSMAKGKVQAEELMQITEAGIPVYPLLAKALGKPVPEIQKLASEGKLLAKDVFPALEQQMNKDYGGAMGKQSQTLTGLWSTLMDTLNLGLANVIKPLMPALRTGLTGATNAAGAALKTFGTGLSALGAAFQGEGVTSNGFVGFMERIGVTARAAFGVFKTEVLPRLREFGGFITGTIIPKVGEFAGFVKTQFVSNVIPAVRNLAETFAPLGREAVAAFKALLPKVTDLGKVIAGKVGPAVRDFTGFLKDHGTIVRSVAVGVAAMLVAVKAYNVAMTVGKAAVAAYTVVTRVLDKVMKMSTFGIVATAIIGIAAALIYAYKHSEKFRNIVNGVGGALKTAFLAVVDFGKGVVKWFKDLPGNVTKGLGDFGKLLVRKGQDLINGLINGIWSIAKGIDKWMMKAPVAKLLAPFYFVARWLVPHGVKFLQGFLGGVLNVAKTVGSWLLRNVIGPVLNAFAKSGQWLVNGGRNAISGLLAGITAYIRGIKGIGTWIYNKVIVPAVTPFAKAKDWLITEGGQLIGGMLGGIAGAMKNIGSWIKSNIIDPVIGAVKKFFGISSPSKVFAEIGGHLIGGLFKGMGSGVGGAIAKKVFGDMPAALRAIVGKGLISVKNLPKKALDALGGAVGVGQPIGGPTGNTSNEGIVRTLAAQYGWASGGQWDSLRALIMGESGFNNLAQNPTSSAFGLFQFLDSTWGSVGASKTSDPWAQTIAGLKYIARSYGSPANAYAQWSARSPHWYEKGTPWVPNDQLAYVHKGEAIIPADVNAAARNGRGGQLDITLHVAPGGDSAMGQMVYKLVRTGVIKLTVGGQPVRVAGA